MLLKSSNYQYLTFLINFHTSVSWWFLSNVSRTLLSILADLSYAVVCLVSTRSLNSKSSSLFINILVTVTSAPIKIGITTTFMLHCFFSFLARSRFLSFLLFSFSFYLWSPGTATFTTRQVNSIFVDYLQV